MQKTVKIIITLIVLIALSVPASGENLPIKGNLYQVSVNSNSEASALGGSGVMPVVRLNHGFLVIAGSEIENTLTEAGLSYKMIASDISKDQIGLDNRLDRENIGKYELLYEEGELRIFRVDPGTAVRAELVRLPEFPIPISFAEPTQIDKSALRGIDDLETLIGYVSQDSLESYVNRLQAFYRRYAGTDSNYAARDWIFSKFTEFGYDSVMIDNFEAYVGASYVDCMNVVAVKLGTVKPEHYVVVGGHHDGVSSSPAADDNGSGVAAVLEMARILKDYQTDLTFIFITFDSEEQGLNGSYHYAENAGANGDSIIYMFNMDMIAHYENSDQAKLYHGDDLTYSELFADLADSLVGITSTYMGNTSGSDHYPFSQQGYQVTFLHEYVFSTVYHSYQDSTAYMNFDYMTKMVKAGLATVYVTSQTYALPAVAFNFPNGLPADLTPGEATDFDVEVYGVNNGVPVSGSGMLYYAVDNGAYNQAAMTEVSAGQYTATLPAADCGSRVSFYVSADETENGTFYDTETPHSAISSVETAYSIQDNFETDQGWTTENVGASSGQWARGIPVDDDSWDYDPAADSDGSGKCFLTQNTAGNTDVDDGAVRLISPVFDMSMPGTISYDYYLYLTNTAGGVDKLLVEICNAGSLNWTTIAVHDQHGGLNWHHYEISDLDIIAAGITPDANMQIRFTANDDDPQSIVEAGVDAFSVSQALCYEEIDVNGFYVFQDTITIILFDDDVLFGQFELTEGETPRLYGIWFFDSSMGLYQPDPYYYTLELTTDDPDIATVSKVGNWLFNFDAMQAGTTYLNVELNLLGELYYGAAGIPVVVDPSYVIGDTNADGIVNISDAVYIVNYIFIGGEAPEPLEAGDASCDGVVNISDAVWIVNYIFIGGNAPGDIDGDGEPDC